MASSAPKTPTPVSSDEKWNHSLENLIRKSTIGFAIGILPGLLLARSAAARSAIIALCTGVGSGIAYGEARYLFDHDIMFDKRHLIQLQVGSKSAQKSIEWCRKQRRSLTVQGRAFFFPPLFCVCLLELHCDLFFFFYKLADTVVCSVFSFISSVFFFSSFFGLPISSCMRAQPTYPCK